MSNEIAILQLAQAKGLGTVSLGRLFRKLDSEKREAEDFVHASPEEMAKDYAIDEKIAKSVVGSRDNAETLYDKLYDHGVQIIALGSELYPDKLLKSLGNKAPPILFVKGNVSLLTKKSVGFCGSRRCSEKGIAIAQEYARIVSRKGINVISGYAYGVDIATHGAALQEGGTTTFVLADGIVRFRSKSIIQEYLDDDNYLIVSEFPPELPWTSHNAMLRNSTICGLSDAVILIESGLQGGTFAAGNTAFELRKPLFAVEFQEYPESAPGNEYFLKRGALPLRENEEGLPDLREVFETIENGIDHSTLSFL